MRRRIVTIVTLAATTLLLSTAPVFAHFNEAAGKGVGTPVQEHVVEKGGLGHIGMECGALAQTPLVPLGLLCPAQR